MEQSFYFRRMMGIIINNRYATLSTADLKPAFCAVKLKCGAAGLLRIHAHKYGADNSSSSIARIMDTRHAQLNIKRLCIPSPIFIPVRLRDQAGGEGQGKPFCRSRGDVAAGTVIPAAFPFSSFIFIADKDTPGTGPLEVDILPGRIHNTVPGCLFAH